MKNLAILCISGLALTSFPALACEKPVAPQMSDDGASYTVESFNALTEGLYAFDSGLAKYRTCLDKIISEPTQHDAKDWSGALSAFNATSQLQTDVYSRYEKIENVFQKSQRLRAASAAQEDRAQSIEASQRELAAQLNQSAPS